jgi:hypothetical protein
MSRPPAIRPASTEYDRARFYLGYRWPGAATVRLPSGGDVSVPHSDCALAEAVLRDRLHRAPQKALLDRFCTEWVPLRGHGEFAWPVAAVDEWLASGNPRRRRATCRPHAPARGSRARASQRSVGNRLLRGGQ